MQPAIQIFVKTPTGKTLQIEIDPARSVLELKKKIKLSLSEIKGPPLEPNLQILLLSGKQMDNSQTLLDYKVEQDSTIYLSVKHHPKDILNWDECACCQCQVIDPCALPCGHSCCKYCVESGATICPVPTCGASLDGLTRDSLPDNWLALKFFDAKKAEPTKACQICAEDGVQTPATHWCESCSKTGVSEFYCTSCVDSEHSTRNTKAHIRVPIQQTSRRFQFSECTRHNIPVDSFCFDDNKFICKRCLNDDHKPPHRTRLIVDYVDEVKSYLTSKLAVLSETSKFDKTEQNLQKSKSQKQSEVKHLESKIEILKKEILGLEKNIREVKEKKNQTKAASLVLQKSVQEFSIKDLFDQEKLKIMESRVHQVVSVAVEDDYLTNRLPTPPRSFHSPTRFRPVLKPKYHFKTKFGGYGEDLGEFNDPRAVVVDGFGNLYIADYANHRVQVFNREYTFSHTFGTKGSLDGQFVWPCALALDPEGNLGVVDYGNHRIQVFDTLGRLKFKFGGFGESDGLLNGPGGIAYDNEANLIISDRENHRIQVFDSNGVYLRKFGLKGNQFNHLVHMVTGLYGNSNGHLYGPIGVAVGIDGTILVSDHGNDRIQIFDSEGQFIKTIGSRGNGESQFDSPWGITVDNTGNILVVDQGNHRIQIFSSSGQFLMQFGHQGSGDGELDHPLHAVIDVEGNIIVADSENHRIQIFG